MPRKKDGVGDNIAVSTSAHAGFVGQPHMSSFNPLLARFPHTLIHPVPFHQIGAQSAAASEEAAQKFDDLRQEQDQLATEYSRLLEHDGLRPRPASGCPLEETRKRNRSTWSNVMDEMAWMANDFLQERGTREATLKTIGKALLANRMRPKTTKASRAIEAFWVNLGGSKDGRSVPSFVDNNKELVSAASSEPILKPELDNIVKMNTMQRLEALRRLDRSSELRSTQSAVVSVEHDFEAALSPVQSNSLRRLSVIGRHGLGSVLCDSSECEHRLTIAAFLARLKSDLDLDGPHLIVGMNDLDLAFCRGYIGLFCRNLKTVAIESADQAALKRLSKHDVAFVKFQKDVAEKLDGSWGAVVFLADDAELATWESVPAMPKSSWGGPIVTLGQSDMSFFGKSSLVALVASVMGMPANRLRELLASPPAEELERDFSLVESLVLCAETEEQRMRRKQAKTDAVGLENAATHGDIHGAAFLSGLWRSDSIPQPVRQVAPAKIFDIDSIKQHSGKFEQALLCLRAERCRRALALSSRRNVLDAFFATCSQYTASYQFYCGNLDSRVAQWIQFVRSSGPSCMVSRFVDLEQAPGSGLNSSIDTILLLDTFTSEQDVARIKAVCKHALILRLYTRGTIDQAALQSVAHPCLVSASATTPPLERCEFRVVPRMNEAPLSHAYVLEQAAKDAVLSAFNDDKTLALQKYAFEFSLGMSGSQSIFAPHDSLAAEPRPSNNLVTNSAAIHTLYYDLATLPRQTVQVSEAPVDADSQSGPLAGPVLVMSLLDKRRDGGGSTSVPTRKRHLGEMLDGNGGLGIGLNSDLNPPMMPPAKVAEPAWATGSVADSPFTRAEDDVILSMLSSGHHGAAFIVEVLNEGRTSRRVPGTNLPPPVRSAKEVSDRIISLQKRSDYRSLITDWPEGPSTAGDSLSASLTFWAHQASNGESSLMKEPKPQSDLIANSLPVSDKRLGPSQLLLANSAPSSRPSTATSESTLS